jgi:thiamine-phosphate pyrophosphorylase
MYRLCLVTNIADTPITEYLTFLDQAIKGGVTMVQLREKGSDHKEIKNRAIALANFLKPLNIPLIINDHLDIALKVDADGMHLGNSDLPVTLAREKLGKDKIIGVSIESMEDLKRANNLPVNYVAASAIFPSITKLNCKTFWGLDGLKKIVDNSLHPVIAIGGIGPEHIKEIMNTGAKGVAVISAIHDSEDPFQSARNFYV